MARRKARRKTPRRRSSGINLVNAAQSIIIANAATEAMFGTTVAKFATEGWLTPKTPGSVSGAGNSWTISASELISGLAGMGYGQSGQAGYTNDMAGLQLAIRKNLKNHGAKALATMIFVPVAFKVGKQLTSKPRRDLNKLLKMGGLNTVVKV